MSLEPGSVHRRLPDMPRLDHRVLSLSAVCALLLVLVVACTGQRASESSPEIETPGPASSGGASDPTGGPVSLIWPHCDGPKWLHLRHAGASVMTV